MQANWHLGSDVTKLLSSHLSSHNGLYRHFPAVDDLTEMDLIRLKKFCGLVTCFAWSDIKSPRQAEEQQPGSSHAFLATSTRDGTVVVWKVNDDRDAPGVSLVHAFDGQCGGEIAAIACLRQPGGARTSRGTSSLGVVCSSHDGFIVCHSLLLSADGDCEVLDLKSKPIWNERDYLTPK